jgi:hypothetical protein
MPNKKHLSTLLNGLFVLTMLLFLLDGLTACEIANQPIKSFTYVGIMALAPLTLIWNLWAFKTRKGKIASSILPALALLGILIIGPVKIVFSSSVWKTQQVLYQNEQLTFKRVESQVQDMGALGYNRRTVEVLYLTELFMIVTPVEKDLDKRGEGGKVGK